MASNHNSPHGLTIPPERQVEFDEAVGSVKAMAMVIDDLDKVLLIAKRSHKARLQHLDALTLEFQGQGMLDLQTAEVGSSES